jgi:cell division protein FtsZ
MSRALPPAPALALFVVCPETVVDVAHALALVMNSDFENSLRLVLLPAPLAHEGTEKQHLAGLAAALLKPRVDAVIHINSQRLAEALGADWHPELAQAKIHETLTQCVKSLADSIHRVGLIGVDFMDVRNCLQQQGDAWVAMGRSEGQNRAERATQQAVQGLQIDCELSRARSFMVCVTGGLDLEIQEFGQVTNVIQSIIPRTTPFLISSIIEPDMTPGQLQVMIIAAGIHG